ncbi:glycosyltransferase family 4 protein [Kitasatospora sp. GAS1066B]|uniref:glycosyltransferase family 4 protein n=1 Tax=Kitasatospora sp. GAS1066B TaxID=3156271 RepID=UPI0035168647
MRIGLVSTTYRPRAGGLETHVTTLAEHLAQAGHQVTVLTNRDESEHPGESVENGVRVIRAGALLAAPDPNEVPWERALFGLLNDFKPLTDEQFDVIHTHTQAALLLASMAGLDQIAPIVASFHETRPETEPGGPARSRFVLTRCPATLVLAGSEAFARQARTFGFPDGLIRTVHLGLPHRERAHSRPAARQLLHQAAGVPEDGVLIALTGRYTPRKAQHRLLDAFQLMEHRKHAHVVLLGSRNGSDAQYLERISARAAELGHRVTVLEDQPDTVRDLLMEAADIVTQPSITEGLGLACIEGMQRGTPAVVNDAAGLREVVTPATGHLIDSADARAYAAALDTLTGSVARRMQLGRAARERATTVFGIDRCAAATTAVYAEAAAITRTAGAVHA